jgi:carbonic anhydrase
MKIRTKLIAASALTALALLAGACGTRNVRATADVLTKAEQQAMTPAQVVADLKAGNERFVAGRTTSQDWLSQARTTAAEGQYPKAIVLSCLDSRVPPEVVFDQGIGDIFVGRVAGNFENVDMLGSMEFGTAVAGAKAIVVLGHTACGAVKGAMDNAELGNLTATLENIRPAINAAIPAGTQVSSKNAQQLDVVTAENVRQTMRDITARSPVLAQRVASGELAIVGGVYDLATGRITWVN